jgi:L-rhamnose mutarotase
MPRVMFTISYTIKPEHRNSYLSLIAQLKDHLALQGRKNYSVFEAKGKKNHFTEVFVTASVEEFDALEDNQDEKTEALVRKLEEFVDDEGMKYSTLIEAL